MGRSLERTVGKLRLLSIIKSLDCLSDTALAIAWG